ncbi:MAG: tetratricopeptide repeat protein [Hyphomonadaceae bacterium]
MKISRVLAATTLAFGLVLSAPAFAQTQQEADAMFAAQDWAGSANAYDGLLREDRGNAANWFALGQARHRLGQNTRALRAYENALANTHPLPGRVRLQIARVQMSMGRRDSALATIQQLVGTGVTHRVLLSTPEFAALADSPEFQAVVAQQTPCNTPEYRQFDFWLGEWDVTPAGAPAATAQNSITRQQDGCVVLEQYTAGGFTGTSINFYDSARQVWHQTWMSNQGGMLYLEGGVNAEGAMEMSDRGLPSSVAANGAINRTIWTPRPDGTVRQLWEASSDNGATWSVVFDGVYSRRSEP